MDVSKLLNALKTKYPQSGLSENEIKGLATALFATGLVTDENVSAIVDAQADAMKGFQSLFDSRFTSQREAFRKTAEAEFEKAFREKYKIGEDGRQTLTEPAPKPQDNTAELIAKLLDERLKPISDKIEAEEARRAAELRTAQILEKAQANGISADLAKLLSVPSDVTDLDSFMKDKAQELKNLGFQPSVPPSAGGVQKTDGQAFAEQIRAGFKKEDK